jgi:hypothetical protein
MYDPANGVAGLVGNGSRFVNQLGSGVSLGFSFNVKLRGCTLLANAAHGVFIGNDATLDLGTAAEPGGNTLQATVGGNIGAGVCNQSFLLISASLGAGCANSVDVTNGVTASCF